VFGSWCKWYTVYQNSNPLIFRHLCWYVRYLPVAPCAGQQPQTNTNGIIKNTHINVNTNAPTNMTALLENWDTIRRKAHCISHTERRNCLLKHVIGGNIGGMKRREMKRKHLLNDLKEMRRYRKLKEEALDRILWRTCSERGSNYRKADKRDDDDFIMNISQLIDNFHTDWTTKSTAGI